MKTVNLVRLVQQLHDVQGLPGDDDAKLVLARALIAITVARAAGRGLAAAVDEALAALLSELETVAR